MTSNETNIFTKFLSSYNDELLSKVSRLDELIGRDHWLSVGNYKESILRNLIANILPRKYEVSTGFIIACDRDGQVLKSRQMDIIIWNSFNYSPIFRDGDFVMVPPEACSAVIEVKGKLTTKELKNSLSTIDSIIGLYLSSRSFSNYIAKYIFAYDIDSKFNFPKSLWQVISNYYNHNDYIALEDRMQFSNQRTHKDLWNPLFSVDAIFILPLGAIHRTFKSFDDHESYRFLFKAYTTTSDSHNHTYAHFESELQAYLCTEGRPRFFTYNQPGLFSIKQNLNIRLNSPKSVMIFPPIEDEKLLPDNFEKNKIFVPKKH